MPASRGFWEHRCCSWDVPGDQGGSGGTADAGSTNISAHGRLPLLGGPLSRGRYLVSAMLSLQLATAFDGRSFQEGTQDRGVGAAPGLWTLPM